MENQTEKNLNSADREKIDPGGNARIVNAPWIVVALIAVLTAVHIWPGWLNVEDSFQFILKYAFLPVRYGAVAYDLPGGVAADYWSPVTYAFLHADWVHLILNSVWMLIFGSVTAWRLGTARFLLLSLVSAVVGAFAFMAVNMDSQTVLIGASGAVSGQMAGAIRIMFAGSQSGTPRSRELIEAAPVLSLGDLLRNRRAVTLLIVWFGVTIVFGVAGFGTAGEVNAIAWEAHIGGFVAGLIMFGLLDRVRVVERS